MILSEADLKMYQQRVRGGDVRSHIKAGRQFDLRKPHPTSSPVGSEKQGLQEGAGSNPAPSPYKSKWEAAYANKLELEKRANLICNYWYEPFSLWLPGKVRYKPDFLVQYFATWHTVHRPGFMTPLELIEVKGWSKNRRDGITRLKIAAALFPCFVWRMVYRTKGGGWDGEYL